MPAVVDPVSGLEYYELSHRWGMYTPIFPGYEEIKLERITHHAKQGVMTHKITTIFHTSTHVNAPIHLVPGASAVGELPLQLGLCAVERSHLIGRRAPRFHEALHALGETLLQIVLRRGQRRVLLAQKPMRLRTRKRA